MPDYTKDLYGKDLFFSDDTQLNAAGDYLTVDEKEALRQAIYRRLITSPGEFAVRPGYGVGLGAYVKKRLTPALLDELRQKILDQLRQDDRIDKVIEVVTESYTVSGQTGIKVYVKVRALGQEQGFTFKEAA